MPTALAVLVIVLLIVPAWLLTFDGMRLVFRGTRNYISTVAGGSLLAARICGTIAALVTLVSGTAAVIALVSLLGGVRLFRDPDLGK